MYLCALCTYVFAMEIYRLKSEKARCSMLAGPVDTLSAVVRYTVVRMTAVSQCPVVVFVMIQRAR